VLSVAVPQSPSDGVAIYFLDDVTFSYDGANDQNQGRRYVLKKLARWWYQLDVIQLQRLVEFIKMLLPERSLISMIDLL